MILHNTGYYNGSVSYITLLSLVSLFYNTAVLADEIKCPDAIKVQQTVNHPPKGWNANSFEKQYSLYGVEFKQSGDSGGLNYDGVGVKKNEKVMLIWFPDKKSTYQIKCIYNQTHTELTKILPDNVRSCWVTVRNNAADDKAFKKLECSTRIMQYSDFDGYMFEK